MTKIGNSLKEHIKQLFSKKETKIEQSATEIAKDTAKTKQDFVLFSHNIPFTPDIDQVIYVEDKPYPKIREVIEKNYESLQELFRKKNYEFVYLPKLQTEISSEVINYMFPFQHSESNISSFPAISTKILKENLVEGTLKGPALLHYRTVNPESLIENSEPNHEETRYEWMLKVGLAQRVPEEWHKNYYFSYREIPNSSEEEILKYISDYTRTLTKGYLGEVLYFAHSKSVDYGDETSDFLFDDSSSNLMKEIQDRIAELRKRGVHEYQLRELFEAVPTVSRLVIKKDFSITLPDYNNLEIEMSPLPKALFMLFLRHPKGILFKEIGNYRDELMFLYKQVARSIDEEAIAKSIDDITDPTKNSINEKCARIREAFVRKFDDVYAKHYYIVGKRGEPKKISLPTEKIIWEVSFDKFQQKSE